MNIEQQAAATLLEKGIKVRVTAPLLFKLFKKSAFHLVIVAPNMGTLIRISELYLSTGLTNEDLDKLNDESSHDLIVRHSHTLNKIIACAWLRGYWRGKLFTGIVATWRSDADHSKRVSDAFK
jgi:hypothetical protein